VDPSGGQAETVALLGGIRRERTSELGTDSEHIEKFMTMLYRARNAEIHGDGAPSTDLYLLSSASTESLAAVVQEAERVMRRAVELVIART
jgi:hypothetical protein